MYFSLVVAGFEQLFGRLYLEAYRTIFFMNEKCVCVLICNLFVIKVFLQWSNQFYFEMC